MSLGWIIVLFTALAAAGCWISYQIWIQNDRILRRVEALERRLLLRRFRVGNQFEADNIVGTVALQDEYRIAKERFKPEDIIIDIGAHIGVFSYLCYAQGSRAVYCYEPGDRNFQLLERNLGSLPGVHLFRAAVWRSDGEDSPELLLSGSAGENTGANSVVAAGRVIDFPSQKLSPSSGVAGRVASVGLDRILERFERVKLLKLDCEGSEFPILLTSRRLDKVERIVGEIHECSEEIMDLLDPRSRVPGYTAYRLEALVACLESLGFRVDTRRGARCMYLFDATRGSR